MGLDADLENAMQWLNAEIGPVEDVDKVDACQWFAAFMRAMAQG